MEISSVTASASMYRPASELHTPPRLTEAAIPPGTQAAAGTDAPGTTSGTGPSDIAQAAISTTLLDAIAQSKPLNPIDITESEPLNPIKIPKAQSGYNEAGEVFSHPETVLELLH